jgi:tetratricopeptide (TPR) repeat protein
MNFICKTPCLMLFLCLWAFGTQTAQAQLDRVFDKQGDNVSGTVVQTSSQGVQIKKAGSTQVIAAGDILKIMHEGDPPALTKAREFALDGQYDQALGELKNLNFETLPRDVIKADAAFFLALCESKLALAGKGKKDAAAKRTLAFAGNHRDSWHLFEAARLLGDLALALNDTQNALKYYKSLGSSRSEDIQIESVYLQGLVHLKIGDSEAALTEFEKVIGLKTQTTHTARLQTLSKAGKAVALAQTGKAADGLTLVKGLIAELNSTDIEMAARIYNAQGASHEAAGDHDGAILAYLHTHLMFSAQPDAHAEALKKLVELWPLVGKPDRAARARQELQQRYPGF